MFPFQFALNSSTLFPFHLGIKEQVRIAAEAGYEGIEIWVRDIETYLVEGGSLSTLRRYVADTGISIVNAIAFWPWMDIDVEIRREGFVQAEKEMNMLASLDCVAAAVPPYGNVAGVTLVESAASFAKITEVARRIGIEPYLEFWGRAQQLYHIRGALYVAELSGVKDAKILLDPFHMYMGGSKLSDLDGISGESIGIVHVNDYPEQPPRGMITDADRVFPGDGIAPNAEFAKLLHKMEYKGYLSLELFKQDYGGLSALDVAKHGREKMINAYSV